MVLQKSLWFTNSEKIKRYFELNLVDELVDLDTFKKVSDVIILAIPVDAIIGCFQTF